jgi:hypothetical protein
VQTVDNIECAGFAQLSTCIIKCVITTEMTQQLLQLHLSSRPQPARQAGFRSSHRLQRQLRGPVARSRTLAVSARGVTPDGVGGAGMYVDVCPSLLPCSIKRLLPGEDFHETLGTRVASHQVLPTVIEDSVCRPMADSAPSPDWVPPFPSFTEETGSISGRPAVIKTASLSRNPHTADMVLAEVSIAPRRYATFS